jgi:hypothetical protein
MLGRVLGGVATSLLFSAFESWLVAEHFKRGFSGWAAIAASGAARMARAATVLAVHRLLSGLTVMLLG